MTEQLSFNIGDPEIDSDDYFAVIEPVFLSVSIYDGPAQYEEDLAKFSVEQRLVLAYHWYLSEVNNGGHDQFYYNSTGIVWPDALKAFAQIGPQEVVALIKASINRFGGNPSLHRQERQDQMDQINPDFEDLDQELFKLEKQVEFDERVLDFIRVHREKFFFSGILEKP